MPPSSRDSASPASAAAAASASPAAPSSSAGAAGAATAPSSAAAAPAAHPKRVSFALPATTADSLSESLLAASFTDSDAQLPLPDANSRDVALNNMSLDRLRDSRQQKYSSLPQEEDDDLPPPLEANASAGHGHSHGAGHGGEHGHSHANGRHSRHGSAGSSHSSASGSASGTECDHKSHRTGRPHSHSHGGRYQKRNQSRSPSASPDSPKFSPIDNCGGLKNKQKALRAEAANKKARKALILASIFCCIFMVLEVIGGFIANSLAIMTDAAHLLSDLAGMLISIFALWLAQRPATSRLSFGFHRAEILGALISVILIWLLTGILVYEACWRLAHPEEVDGKIMFIVATCGLLVNGAMGVILIKGGHGHSHGGLPGSDDHGHSHSHGPAKKNRSINDHGHSHAGGDDHGHSHGGSASPHSSAEYKLQDERTEIAIGHSSDGHGHAHGGDDEHEHIENLNIKAALLHVLGDAVQSVGVMIAAAFIWYEPDWHVADPLCTFLFSVLVLFTTTRLIKQSIGVLMEGVPEGIVPDEVEEALLAVPGVIAVHDLHIWSLSVGRPSLSVHLYCRDDAAGVLALANKVCADRFNIHHSTIQVERQHDEIACNDAFVQLDGLAQEEFSQLGINVQPMVAEQV